MARSARASKLETRTARLKLPVAKKPVFVKIGHGVGLGYRRNQIAGTWVVRVADGRGGNWIKVIAHADDFEEADSNSILTFWQAQERARLVARGGTESDRNNGKLTTVAQALDRYQADLEARAGDVANVARVRAHLSDALAQKAVALLTPGDLRLWRDGLANRKLTPASINRSSNAFRAALNLAADQDDRVVNHRAWKKGLASIHDVTEARNVVLPNSAILRLIDSAYQSVGQEFGLLVEVAAVTGAQVSQLRRLEVHDVQGDRGDPRLMMPSSRKGRGQKKILRRPVPIPASLVELLQRAAGDRPDHAPLLTKPSGDCWKQSDHTRLFQRAAKHAGLNPSDVTIYALRHSNIVRQLLASVPTRVVAANHDTSVTIIEKNYSRYIGDHSDSITRRALLNAPSRPAHDGKVVLLSREIMRA